MECGVGEARIKHQEWRIERHSRRVDVEVTLSACWIIAGAIRVVSPARIERAAVKRQACVVAVIKRRGTNVRDESAGNASA